MKFKFKIRIISVLLLLIFFNLGINIVEKEHVVINSNIDTQYYSVTVKPGDTIWDLVKENYESIEKPWNMDYRDLVHYVIELNQGTELKVGQTLLIPKIIK